MDSSAVSIVFNDYGKRRARFLRVTAQARQFIRHLLQFYRRNIAIHFKYFRADFRADLVPHTSLFVNLHSHADTTIRKQLVSTAAVNLQG
jgi:hypothetical protein